MPISTTATISDFEFLVSGRADYPEVIFSGDDFTLVSVPTFGFENALFFGTENTVALVDGEVANGIVGGGDGFAAVLIGSNGSVLAGNATNAIGLFGTNANIVLNAGFIDGGIQMNRGQNLVVNVGLIFGDVRMGAGDDFFINDNPTAFGLEGFSDIFGNVYMGSGDDTVLNASVMENVYLGNGNDFYAAITPLSEFDNFDNPDVFHFGSIYGGNGNDTVFAGANNDVIFGGAGNDELNGHNGDDRISGGNNKDVLRGGNGDDELNGNAGKDVLNGGNGDDTLRGGTGEDRIIGGRGDDRLIGGSGGDVFVFNAFANSIGNDTIVDFREGDLIEIRDPADLDFDTLVNFITYDSGTAQIDLGAALQAAGNTFDNGQGNILTLLGVANGSLDADDFLLF